VLERGISTDRLARKLDYTASRRTQVGRDRAGVGVGARPINAFQPGRRFGPRFSVSRYFIDEQQSDGGVLMVAPSTDFLVEACGPC